MVGIGLKIPAHLFDYSIKCVIVFGYLCKTEGRGNDGKDASFSAAVDRAEAAEYC